MSRYLYKARILCLFFIAQVASAADSTVGVSDAWARATPPGAVAGAAYCKIANTGSDTVTLESVTGGIAKSIELHTHIHEDGLMKMRKLDMFEIDAKASQSFEPGHNHIMLIGLNQPLERGGSFELTFNFSNGENETVEIEVR